MDFNFKREFGISDLIALAALLVSLVAIWQSYRATAPYVLVASGPVLSGAVSGVDRDKCMHIAQIPIEINNSGGRSVVFQRLLRDGSLPPVMFSKSGKMVQEGLIKSEIFLSSFDMQNPEEWTIARENSLKLDIESAAFLSMVIPPGQSLKRYVVVKSSAYKAMEQLADTLYLALIVELSDGQQSEFRASFSLPPPEPICANR